MNFENLKSMVTNKETWVKVGKGSMKLGKVIVVKGSQAVVANGVAKVLTTSFDEGLSGVKNLSFDDVIGVKNKDKTPKKKLFSKKQEETEELLEDIAENNEQVATVENDEEEIIETVEAEVIDK